MNLFTLKASSRENTTHIDPGGPDNASWLGLEALTLNAFVLAASAEGIMKSGIMAAFS